jgi:hypothetical protein
VVRESLGSSTVLDWIEYDAAVAQLDVHFRSGERYRYFQVPVRIVTELRHAGSPGQYFVESIRDVYPAQRLD